MEFVSPATNAPATFAQNQSTRHEVRKPKHSSSANFGPLSRTVSLQSLSNDIAQPTEPTLPPITRLQISWGECGIPRSLKHRRFLEQMVEEVAVREGFQYAKIL